LIIYIKYSIIAPNAVKFGVDKFIFWRTNIMKKITVIGVGNVGATIAYTLVTSGMASELVLIDINKKKAEGEAMDILQGAAFCSPVNVYAGEYSDAKDSDIIVVTLGIARKPGQSRIDLAQFNVNIIKDVMPQIVKYAPNAIYVVVSNPVDVLTYALIKSCGLSEKQVIGSGTMLDSARLRAGIAKHVDLSPNNIHAYVFGEHGDSSMIPWSLTSIAGMEMTKYCSNVCQSHNACRKAELLGLEEYMRTSGAKIIELKGATYYAVALAVRRICECVFSDSNAILTVSTMVNGRYGINDVCLSLPSIIDAHGIAGEITPPLLPEELDQLRKSADAIKLVLSSLTF